MVVHAHDVDHQNLISTFPICIKFIEECLQNGGRVLVHCGAGVSRSATVVIAYVMWKLNLTYNQAMTHVMSARSCVFPNRGFVKQLTMFEQLGCDLKRVELKDDALSDQVNLMLLPQTIYKWEKGEKKELILVV